MSVESGWPHTPGFYPDPGNLPLLRWWDGQQWTERTAPPPPPPSPPKRSALRWWIIGGVSAVLLVVAAVVVVVVVRLAGDPVVVTVPGGQGIRASDVGKLVNALPGERGEPGSVDRRGSARRSRRSTPSGSPKGRTRS